MKGSLKKIVLSGILASFALISFILESLFPPLFIPGARMGISNVFILLVLIILDEKYAYAVLFIKIILGSIFIGNISAVLYSLPSGIISLTVEIIFLRFFKSFSIVAISVLGAVINTFIQNTVFCLINGSFSYFLYLPYLSIIAFVTGLIIGFAVYLVIRFLPDNVIHTFN